MTSPRDDAPLPVPCKCGHHRDSHAWSDGRLNAGFSACSECACFRYAPNWPERSAASPEQSEPVGEEVIDTLLHRIEAAPMGHMPAVGFVGWEYHLLASALRTARATLHRVEEERNVAREHASRLNELRDEASDRAHLNWQRYLAATGREHVALSAFASLKRDVEGMRAWEMGMVEPVEWLQKDRVLELLARHDPNVSLSEPPKPENA